MWYFGLFVFAILGCILTYFLKSGEIKQKLNQRDKLRQLILDNVKIKSKTFINEEATKAIAIDEQNKKVHLFSLIENKCLIYNFNDIIQSEIIIDNNTIISTKRGAQMLGAAVGTLIAGVPGMIVGGLSSGKQVSENIKNVELKLTLNDMNNSIFKINFLNPVAANKGLSRDFHLIRNALTEVEKWQGYFGVILKQQNQVM